MIDAVVHGGSALRIEGRLRSFGIASFGIWSSRHLVAELLGAEPVWAGRMGRRDVDAMVGWGHKPSAREARRIAAERRLPYIALEDGFLRSVRPGTSEPAIGWVVDRTGIYYDAAGPSDLEIALERRSSDCDEATRTRVATALAEIRRRRLSKYNHAPLRTAAELGLPAHRDIVLVIDQTVGDASIGGASVDCHAFVRMLEAAVAENPGRTVAVKVHPETISGAKRGHLLDAARHRGVVVVSEDVNPWSLIEIALRAYVVSSQFGLEAAMAGIPVTCFGAAFYAGWGVTDDRFTRITRRTVQVDPLGLAGAVYLDYCRWIDPWSRREVDFETAIDVLGFLRDRHQRGTRTVCLGFSRWKRRSAARFLDGIGGPPLFVDRAEHALALARKIDARLAVWGSREIEVKSNDQVEIVRVEDGFLRSVGLGASFVAPMSLVSDDIGIYYDPSRPSRFEMIAQTANFDLATVARAARLRSEIVARGLSKYNEAAVTDLELPKGRRIVLVPGQVADDASVRLGSPEVADNLTLLERVRQRDPTAYVVFKPHPDVQKGYRSGAIPEAVVLRYADRVVGEVAITSLLDVVDAVETMTSLTGFEALLRGIPVTTHGAPFYSGWGLTEDLHPISRRTRHLTLDELVAAALILYPDYNDPETGLPCPVEVILDRLSQTVDRQAAWHNRIRRSFRHGIAWTSHNILGPIVKRL